MTAVSLLALLLASLASAGAASPEAPPTHDAAPAVVWSASGVVAADGELRLLPGWRVRIGLGGRAHLVGPMPRAPRAEGLWDDQAIARGVRVAVRATAHHHDAVYVEGRFQQASRVRSFLLRWDAASGAWTEATVRV